MKLEIHDIPPVPPIMQTEISYENWIQISWYDKYVLIWQK